MNVNSLKDIENIQLFNQLGQQIFIGNKLGNGGSVQLNLKELPKGFYFLKINEATKRIIKN